METKTCVKGVRRWGAAVVFSALFAPLPPGYAQQGADETGLKAKVGEISITQGQVDEYLRANCGVECQLFSPGTRKLLEQGARENLIERKLLLLLAAQSGFKPNQDEGAADGERHVLAKFLNLSVSSKVIISEDDVQAAAQKFPQMCRLEPEVRIRQIVVPLPPGKGPEGVAGAREAAEKLIATVEASPAEFVSIAKQHSRSGVQPTDGDVGYVAPGQLESKLSDELFASKAGTVIGPLLSPAAFHILRVEEVVDGGDAEDCETGQIWLREKLLREREGAVLADLLTAAKAQFPVERFD